MKTYKIHLIRHGATDANAQGKYIGSRTDLPLSPEGARELISLKETTEYPQVDRLYSSPMLRCRQSAAIIYPGKGLYTVDNLIEYDFGDFEGKTAAQLEANQDFSSWVSGQAPPPGGEENEAFIKRVCLGLNQIVRDMMDNSAATSAVIMHGGAIMMLLSSMAVPQRRAIEWTTDPGRGFSLLITPSLYHSSGVGEVFGVI